MRPLVDIETVKRNLKVNGDDDDQNLAELIDQASAIALDFIKVPLDTYEDESTEIPLLLRAATMAIVRALYDSPEDDPLNAAVKSILWRLRDPAIA